MALEAGLTASLKHTVEDGDTAVALGSGDVPVLGTPKVLALCEEATVAAIAEHLEPGTTTVGCGIQLDHLAPTLAGATVQVEAVLSKIDGRRLVFVVRVNDDRSLVAAGKITRALVDRDRFLDKASGD